MPPREPVIGGGRARRPFAWSWLCVLVVAVVALSGCSRLSFVKADPGRRGFDRTAPEVEVSSDRRTKNDSVLSLLKRGQELLLAGDLNAAEKHAQQALRLDGRSAPAYTLLALVEDRRGRNAQAGQHYLRAMELAPRKGVMLNNYAVWLCANGRAGEAVPLFEKALADPGYPTPAAALANAGACADRAGINGKTDQYLRAAIELEPTNVIALGTLAERAFRADNAFEARAFSERRLAAGPADARSLHLASQIEEKLGDKAAAAKYVRRMREEFPNTSGSITGDGSKR